MSVLLEDSGYPIPLNIKYTVTPEDIAEAEKALSEFRMKLKGTKTVVPPKEKPKKSKHTSSIYNIDAGRMF